MTGASARDELRADARAIIRHALDAAQPAQMLARLHTEALPEPLRAGAAVLAVGKAADAMLGAVVQQRLVPVWRALVVAAAGGHEPARHGIGAIRITGAHPLPDATSESAARAVIDWLAELPDGLPLLVLLSGGTSALLALPPDDVTINELAHTTALLLRAGAPIDELNLVRRALDRVKGGGLAERARDRPMLALVISDVIGDRLDVIGSAPFHPTPAQPKRALTVLRRRGVLERVPDGVRRYLEQSATPAAGTASTARVSEPVPHWIIGSNATVIDAAARAARLHGYHIDRIPRALCGEAREVGAWLAARALTSWARGRKAECTIAGGETTVRVRGDGRGGRNQELALAAALRINGEEGIVVASIGTDGRDGPTDAAGAIVDGGTAARIAAAGLDAVRALERNDSFTALNAAGDLVRTGATGTNVGDLQLVLSR